MKQERSGRASKHEAIWEAAKTLFLREGYDRISMDQVAETARVSKQTVYQHFHTKEELFLTIVTEMTSGASDDVHHDVRLPNASTDAKVFLTSYAERQLQRVLDPALMRLRRLVIGEVGRFPELAMALHQNGPKRAIRSLSKHIERFAQLGELKVDDNLLAAEDFNWLVMGGPVNNAMLLADNAVLSPSARRKHAEHAVALFVKAYAPT